MYHHIISCLIRKRRHVRRGGARFASRRGGASITSANERAFEPSAARAKINSAARSPSVPSLSRRPAASPLKQLNVRHLDHGETGNKRPMRKPSRAKSKCMRASRASVDLSCVHALKKGEIAGKYACGIGVVINLMKERERMSLYCFVLF